MTMLIAISITFLAWLYLIIGRGGFWRAAERDYALPAANQTQWPRIVAVIPARDEADVIAASVGSLMTQQYRGGFSVIVVDDHSDDATRTIAERVAAVHSLSLIHI